MKEIKKFILIDHNCLPILMLLYVMLYIMLAYLMLFAALCNAFFQQLIFANAFCYHALSWIIDIVCLFQVRFSIMRSAFSLLVFPNSMFIPFFV